jgi:hypothetical protein
MTAEVVFDTSGFLALMKERAMREVLTTDAHFRKAGFVPLLVD